MLIRELLCTKVTLTAAVGCCAVDAADGNRGAIPVAWGEVAHVWSPVGWGAIPMDPGVEWFLGMLSVGRVSGVFGAEQSAHV